MSIEEALNRVRNEQPSVLEGNDKKNRQEAEYKQALLARGRDILDNSGATTAMDKLREYIAKDHSDAKTVNVEGLIDVPNIDRKFLLNDGKVELKLGWQYRKDFSSPYKTNMWNQISVVAYPLTGDVAVLGIGAEFIPAATLQKPEGKILLEDAIALAYKNPPIHTPSVRIG